MCLFELSGGGLPKVVAGLDARFSAPGTIASWTKTCGEGTTFGTNIVVNGSKRTDRDVDSWLSDSMGLLWDLFAVMQLSALGKLGLVFKESCNAFLDITFFIVMLQR